MAQHVEHNPLQDALAALLTQGLDGAGEALRILVDEASKIERSRLLNAQPHERSAERHNYANGFKPKTCHQFIIAVTGAFNVVTDDGVNRSRHHLNRSYFGLYLPPLVWRELDNFSSESVCLVLASAPYDETGYFRDYDDFRKAVVADR